MQTPQVTVGPDTPIVEAAGRLAEEEIDSLVVTDRESPVGVLTEADEVGLIASSGDRSTPVADVMSAQGISVEADESIEDAAGTLREADVPTLPVRDREGCLAGVLTVMELADVESATAGPAGGQDEPSTQRRSSRPDTAYERADWEFDGSGEGEATLAVGDVVTFAKPVTEGDVAAFAEASGDTNRLHLEEEFAARTRFGRRIVHGTLVGGLISAALARLPGLTIYLSQTVTYSGPVDIGDRATARCEVVEALGEDRYRLATEVLVDGEPVIEGEATVLSDPMP